LTVRRLRGTVIAAAAVLFMTGCASPTQPGNLTSPQQTFSPSKTPSASSSEATNSAGGTMPCSASDLTGVLKATPGGGAAGSVILEIVAANSSTRSCVLEGVPRVFYTGNANGIQLGAEAHQTGVSTATAVTLAPGESAIAPLKETNAKNYPACTEAAATGLRVYPPGGTDSLFIAQTVTACTNSDIVLLSVKPFQAG